MLWVCAEPPTASRRNGTGVLWVLTGTHWCDDPVSHSASSCSALLLGFVLCGCRVRALIGAIFDHTPPLSTRVVGSGDLNITFLSKHTTSIFARALREFISSELPRHQHDFTSTLIPLNCVREDISQSLVTHTEPFTSNTNSKSSCAMPRA